MTRLMDKYLGRLSTIKADVVMFRIIVLGLPMLLVLPGCDTMSRHEKRELRDKALEMFHHAYKNYMDNAYPADELMPLSCKGRYRGTSPSRGDIDDALGNFSLTLIDTLDTLLVLGLEQDFEKAVSLAINNINFDNDVVVSVFETNIRVVGGLLGGHLMADFLKRKMNRMSWYNDELLKMAEDLGNRLLPAFNTSTGMPYPRVNLRYGVKHEMSRTGSEKDTCTACAGTMLLEFSALSRLTGNRIFEEKAIRAMDYLWESRHRSSDLVGTVINIHNGDWVRRESGIGAGIDSYYEYLLKGYIMLGEDTYLERFNKHYKAVMKYVNNGPLMLDVHMHRPQMNSRNFMDALLAFWPGLQVLKGDLKSAIEIHEMLYQVTLRHNFLPEAFTTDFRVHWAQHPLRPEFLESTYFIYKATGDPYYLEVGKSVIENLDRHARVPCGFAAIKDVTTGTHEDQMDSYVLAETFKYLYLLFSEKEDLLLNVDDYIFTTEAHLLPLFLSMHGTTNNKTDELNRVSDELIEDDNDEEDYDFHNTCPSTSHLFKGKIDFAHHLRSPLKNMVENLCPKPKSSETRRLHASEFMAGNKDQIALLNRMGIRIITMSDGRVQLLHLSNEAASVEDSTEGLMFMQEMIELSKAQTNDASLEPRVVQLMSPPFFGSVVLKAGPAQFGVNLKNHPGIEGPLAVAAPLRGCQPLSNLGEIAGKLVMVERGDCMFVDKARHLQNAGAIGGIIFDNNSQSSADSSALFSMSGDGKTDVIIPLVFLFHSEAKVLQEALTNNRNLVVYVSERLKKSDDVLLQYLRHKSHNLSVGPSTGSEVTSSGENGQSQADEENSTVDPRGTGGTLEYSRGTSETLESNMEKNVEDLILLLLRRIGFENLQPYIRTRSKDKLETWISGSFRMRVIRMHESEDEIQMEMKNEEEGQRIIKLVFTEFLLLLMECTNLGQVKELNQVMDALARLTENVFTSGRMGYGVHTETVISSLKDQLVISKTCSTSGILLFPAVPEVVTKSDGGMERDHEDGQLMTSDGVQLKITLSGDDDGVGESQELRQMVHKFVEDQLGILVKELIVASSDETSSSSSVEVVVASNPLATESDGVKIDEAGQKSLFVNGYRLKGEERIHEIEEQVKKLLDREMGIARATDKENHCGHVTPTNLDVTMGNVDSISGSGQMGDEEHTVGILDQNREMNLENKETLGLNVEEEMHATQESSEAEESAGVFLKSRAAFSSEDDQELTADDDHAEDHFLSQDDQFLYRVADDEEIQDQETEGDEQELMFEGHEKEEKFWEMGLDESIAQTDETVRFHTPGISDVNGDQNEFESDADLVQSSDDSNSNSAANMRWRTPDDVSDTVGDDVSDTVGDDVSDTVGDDVSDIDELYEENAMPSMQSIQPDLTSPHEFRGHDLNLGEEGDSLTLDLTHLQHHYKAEGGNERQEASKPSATVSEDHDITASSQPHYIDSSNPAKSASSSSSSIDTEHQQRTSN